MTSTDTEVMQIGSLLGGQLEEVARRVAAKVRATIDVYDDPQMVNPDQYLDDVTEELRLVMESFKRGSALDISPATAAGVKRAASGVPLAAVLAAFRVATHHLWDEMVAAAKAHPEIGNDALLRATALLWHAQDTYTDAMTSAYREQSMQQVLEDESERSALTEALLQARISDERTLWEVAQLLRLPQKGPYVVVAATCPAIGKQALPGVATKLRSIDIYSAWRLLPDVQTGVVHISSDKEYASLLDLLHKLASARVGVSPRFDNLADTAQALRYARVAATTRTRRSEYVTVFEDSALAVAAVSAPEVTAKLASIILGRFDDLPAEERQMLLDTFRAWVDNKGSMAKAGEQLYCHANTVRYRLRRIEERTGRSLSEPQDIAELCLAFEIQWHTW
jgi:sugar diacid utilization regulator